MAIRKTCPRGCRAAIDYVPNEKNRLVMVNTKQSTLYTAEGKVHKGYLPHSATCSAVRRERAQKKLPLAAPSKSDAELRKEAKAAVDAVTDPKRKPAPAVPAKKAKKAKAKKAEASGEEEINDPDVRALYPSIPKREDD